MCDMLITVELGQLGPPPWSVGLFRSYRTARPLFVRAPGCRTAVSYVPLFHHYLIILCLTVPHHSSRSRRTSLIPVTPSSDSSSPAVALSTFILHFIRRHSTSNPVSPDCLSQIFSFMILTVPVFIVLVRDVPYLVFTMCMFSFVNYLQGQICCTFPHSIRFSDLAQYSVEIPLYSRIL